MIVLKTPQEIEAMRPAGQLAAEVLAQLGKAIQPGISLKELDRMAAAHLKRVGAEPTYLGYRQMPNQPPFPGVITTSLNDEVCHGIPDKRVLKDGDIICIDIGLRYQGWCGDTCMTWGVGQISPKAKKLIDVTRQCLEQGIKAVKPGGRIGDIGAAIKKLAGEHGYSIVREFGGHGIGEKPHENPFVSHEAQAGTGLKIRPGLVFTIEPMINAGGARIKMLKDGWTAVTADGSLSAQFEHILAVTKKGVEVLTAL
jgi:methionyl aminopeptidase